jgi:hypothetical protein
MMELEFKCHYNEPNLELTRVYRGDDEMIYLLNYEPQIGKWTIDMQDDAGLRPMQGRQLRYCRSCDTGSLEVYSFTHH